MNYFIVFCCQISHCYTFLFLQVFSVTLPRFIVFPGCTNWFFLRQGLPRVLIWARAFSLWRCCFFFCFFFACFVYLLHFWFYAGFLGVTSSFFLSFWLHNLFLSVTRACRVYYFGQGHLVCGVVAFFNVFLACCHPF